ncbi:nucleolar protein,Nop52-domain-containing protein [Talaromyces proteolyticus]|uniref:Nucleolar protein,Nop52-domain-containing protein n=1 Tax=Talaromyces proteolyticus TaxID=1131652 RepID=A0AAD4PW14_9EURO|nr:nucleolar protein,Nop52-domain-containing protein [Talaromyces proteolyticus]KAH8697350.1 nucleolar protein,Nop52-domain-containing protein [Talaromyces proteolyticus]
MATATNHAEQIQKTPFVKELASSERKTRDKALESLSLFLRARRDLSLLELLKIWKGLFFCFYHSDRPLTQQALARDLSYTLVPSLPRESRLRFLRAFWITIGREFHALDRLRLDKYLLLIRYYVGVAFEVYLQGQIGQSDNTGDVGRDGKKRKRAGEEKSKNGKRRKQDSATAEAKTEENNIKGEKWAELESYITLLEQGPLCPINFDPTEEDESKEKKSEEDSIPMPHGPDGLRYHINDIWLDELAKVIDTNSGEDEGEGQKSLKDRFDIPMDLLLRPFKKLKNECPTKSVRLRVSREVLEDARLVEWGFREKVVEEDSDVEEDEWDGLGD